MTLWVTTAAYGDTVRLGISCAADFCRTKHFFRLISSTICSQTAGKCSLALGWVLYSNARSRSAPVAAACTGIPLVSILTSSSTAPNPFKSPKHRCMCTGSISGATSDPPIARATSPTTPRLSRLTVVQMLASVYSSSSLSRASRSLFPSFYFSACHCCTKMSNRFRLRDSPLGSSERADSILSRASTEASVGSSDCCKGDWSYPCPVCHSRSDGRAAVEISVY